MEKKELQTAWLKSAQEEFQVAKDLFNLKRYSACLFFCHLTIEKLFKALYFSKNDNYPPPTHNLVYLAKKAQLDITIELETELREINTFNIEARYDILKEKLYKKATREYTIKYFEITKKIINKFKKEV